MDSRCMLPELLRQKHNPTSDPNDGCLDDLSHLYGPVSMYNQCHSHPPQIDPRYLLDDISNPYSKSMVYRHMLYSSSGRQHHHRHDLNLEQEPKLPQWTPQPNPRPRLDQLKFVLANTRVYYLEGISASIARFMRLATTEELHLALVHVCDTQMSSIEKELHTLAGSVVQLGRQLGHNMNEYCQQNWDGAYEDLGRIEPPAVHPISLLDLGSEDLVRERLVDSVINAVVRCAQKRETLIRSRRIYENFESEMRKRRDSMQPDVRKRKRGRPKAISNN